MKPSEIKAAIVVIGGIVATIAGLMWGIPTYRVWSKGMAGKATLREAESTKMVMIETAKAELEAAKLRAEAIATIGEMAQKYPEYRHQEFIAAFGEAIQSGEIEQIIYVPTEANIPIVEAGRMVPR